MPPYSKAGLGKGIGQGLGRFSNALMGVLQSGEGRKRREEDVQFRDRQQTGTEDYRKAVIEQQTYGREATNAREEGRREDRRRETIGVRQDNAADREARLRETGQQPVDRGAALGATSFGGAVREGLMEQGEYIPDPVAGEYDPEQDLGLGRQIRTDTNREEQRRQTLASTPEGPDEFSFKGGRFGYTPEGYQAAQEHGEALEGIGGAQAEDPMYDERRDALLQEYPLMGTYMEDKQFAIEQMARGMTPEDVYDRISTLSDDADLLAELHTWLGLPER